MKVIVILMCRDGSTLQGCATRTHDVERLRTFHPGRRRNRLCAVLAAPHGLETIIEGR
jgi:hypothetical protein